MLEPACKIWIYWSNCSLIILVEKWEPCFTARQNLFALNCLVQNNRKSLLLTFENSAWFVLVQIYIHIFYFQSSILKINFFIKISLNSTKEPSEYVRKFIRWTTQVHLFSNLKFIYSQTSSSFILKPNRPQTDCEID